MVLKGSEVPKILGFLILVFYKRKFKRKQPADSIAARCFLLIHISRRENILRISVNHVIEPVAVPVGNGDGLVGDHHRIFLYAVYLIQGNQVRAVYTDEFIGR